MTSRPDRITSGIEKRGGYTGGSPKASLKPPAKIASGAIKPASSNGSAPKK
jgi:hypothetical protein